MSNRRNKRRFYPEFYMDGELNHGELPEEEEEMEETGETESEGREIRENNSTGIKEPEKIHVNVREDFIYNIFDRTKKPEIKESPDVSKDANKNEIILEIPKHMYLNDIAETDELSAEENEEIHKMFDAVADKPDKISEPKILENPEAEESTATFAEYSDLKNPEIDAESIKETEPEKIIPPETVANPNLIPFDREMAIEYAKRWALDRNPKYFNFEDIGGDCTNYISQILFAGGCKMDRNSVLYGWYYINANEKSPSWTGVEQLYDYLTRAKDYGIMAKEIELNEVEAGDIAQLSFNGKTFQHTPFIVSANRHTDGTVSHDRIKICAHSFDSENRPLDTYQWKKIRFIRVLGFREY